MGFLESIFNLRISCWCSRKGNRRVLQGSGPRRSFGRGCPPRSRSGGGGGRRSIQGKDAPRDNSAEHHKPRNTWGSKGQTAISTTSYP